MADVDTSVMKIEDMQVDLFNLLEDCDCINECKEKEDRNKMQIDAEALSTYLNNEVFFMSSGVPTSPVSSYSSENRSPQPMVQHSEKVKEKPLAVLQKPGVKQKIPRHKRTSHIKAEHKRRNKIQNGFTDLKQLVPSIRDTAAVNGSKDSKASMLSKTVVYCRQLRAESKDLHKEMDALREEINNLTSEINTFQQQLPANGAVVPPGRSSTGSQSRDADSMVEDYIKARTFQNWKFWIFSMVMRPLWTSFKSDVASCTGQNFFCSVMNWIQTHCSIVSLRPALLNTLTNLCGKTSILTTPEQLPSEAIQYVIQETFLSNAAKETRFQDYRSEQNSGQVTPLSSGYRTPLSSGQRTPLSTGQKTPLSSGQRTPLSSGPLTPLSSGQLTPLSSGPLTPLSSGQLTPLSSGQLTPLSSGQLTPLSQHVTPLSSGQCTPLTQSDYPTTPPLSSGQCTPVGNATPVGSISPNGLLSTQTVHLSGSMSPLIFPNSPITTTTTEFFHPCTSQSPMYTVTAPSAEPFSVISDPIDLLSTSSSLTSHSLSFSSEFSTLSPADHSLDLLFTTQSMSCS